VGLYSGITACEVVFQAIPLLLGPALFPAMVGIEALPLDQVKFNQGLSDEELSVELPCQMRKSSMTIH